MDLENNYPARQAAAILTVLAERGDSEALPSSLSVTAASNDQTLIPNANIEMTGTDANRMITVPPGPFQHGGPATITIVVSDGIDHTQETFDVTVSSVPNAPVANADTYDLWVNSVSTGTSQFVRESSLTTNSYTPDGDWDLGRYRYWVRGIDEGGRPARWARFEELVVAVAPQPLGPVGGI